mmetsp:Transcript_19003/g.30929  ORF Transcript_19003/g.30929 Transcript_19003/m.30929 type:complete len:100 (+) Transcript_19003:669-968(+)
MMGKVKTITRTTIWTYKDVVSHDISLNSNSSRVFILLNPVKHHRGLAPVSVNRALEGVNIAAAAVDWVLSDTISGRTGHVCPQPCRMRRLHCVGFHKSL